jgi:hypothetical protein
MMTSARKPSYFQLENPVGIVEGQAPAQEQHWLEECKHGLKRIAGQKRTCTD